MSIDKLERSNQRLDAAVPADPPNAAGSGNRSPAGNAASRQYAEELAARFQAYVDWAIDHWPIEDQPPAPAFFERSRQELNALCRQAGAPLDNAADPDVPGGAQFVPVTPMPWP